MMNIVLFFLMLLFVVHFFVHGRRATVGVRAALRGPRGRTGTHPDISYASCFRPATRGSMRTIVAAAG